MKFCKVCVFPDTKPDLTFNEDGVCSEDILKTYKTDNGYDCIVPVSGGKDSTYQVWYIKEKLGLNPLCVHFEPTERTELGARNLRALREIGVDMITWDKDPKVYKAMGLEAFKRVGDHEWPNHIGIFTVPVITAVKFNIPLIIWGENSQAEYGGPATSQESRYLNRRWLEEFGGLLGNRIYDMIGVDGITEKDVLPYMYPSDEEIEKVGVTGLFLGYYVKWDAKAQMDVIRKYGWSEKLDGPVEGTYSNHENLD
ncbi:MAG: N-acetyl sugar amidotransferase, partial [Bdellovibrionales bacterium]|nr:N-acetyl sugar amidotransferase [Bdellovibrionales bacterium]